MCLGAVAALSGAGGCGGAGDDSAPPRCVGKTALRRIPTNRTVTAAGVARTFVVYEPPRLDADAPVPLVFVHHGFSSSGQEMFDI